MLNSVFLKTLRDMRVPFLWWGSGLLLMNIWIVTLFPSIAQASGLESYFDAMPESMMAIFGITDVVMISTLEGFLTLELMSLFLPALTIAFGVSFGGSLISREEDDGSLDLLLANPIPRWQVALEKFGALVVFTSLVALASYAGLALGVVIADLDGSSVYLLDGMISIVAITLFFGALAYCLTCLRRGRTLAIGMSAGLAVVTFFTTNLGELANLPEWTQKLSPWHYYDGGRVLIDGLQWGNVWLLFGLTALLIALGAWGFGQRDLGT